MKQSLYAQCILTSCCPIDYLYTMLTKLTCVVDKITFQNNQIKNIFLLALKKQHELLINYTQELVKLLDRMYKLAPNILWKFQIMI